MHGKQFIVLFFSFSTVVHAAFVGNDSQSVATVVEKYRTAVFLNVNGAIPEDLKVINDLGAGVISLFKTEKGIYFLGGIRRVIGRDSGDPKFKLSIGGKVLANAISLHAAVSYRRNIETFGLLPISTIFPVFISPLITIVGGESWGPYITLFMTEIGYNDEELKKCIKKMNVYAQWYNDVLQFFDKYEGIDFKSCIFESLMNRAKNLDIDVALMKNMKSLQEGELQLTQELVVSIKQILYNYTKTLQFLLVTPEVVRAYLRLAEEEYKSNIFERRHILEHALHLVSFDR